MEVNRAAEILADGLEQGRREIHFPKPRSWTTQTLRALPYPLLRVAHRQGHRRPAAAGEGMNL